MAKRSPLILQSINPKSERMAYITYLRKYKLVDDVSVCWKQNAERIIIGPKDFYLNLGVTLDFCSQEQLDVAWAARIGMEKVGMELAQEVRGEESKATKAERRMMDLNSSDLIANLGFGGKKKEEGK